MTESKKDDGNSSSLDAADDQRRSVPLAMSEAIDIEGQALDSRTIARILKAEEQGHRTGRTAGFLLTVTGLVLIILGFSGSVNWIVEFKGFTSRLTNATPGVFLVVVGAVLLVFSRPSVRIRK